MKNLLRIISPLVLGGALLFSSPQKANAEEPKTFTSLSSGSYFADLENPLFNMRLGGGPYFFDKQARLEASIAYDLAINNATKLEGYEFDLIFNYLFHAKKDVDFRIGAGLGIINFVETKMGASSTVNESFGFGPVFNAGLDINIDKNYSIFFELLGNYNPLKKGGNIDGGISLNAGITFNSFF